FRCLAARLDDRCRVCPDTGRIEPLRIGLFHPANIRSAAEVLAAALADVPSNVRRGVLQVDLRRRELVYREDVVIAPPPLRLRDTTRVPGRSGANARHIITP